MDSPLKIIIPTAGYATRMRPQTWSKPKPLVSVAGRTALDHLLDTFKSLPPDLPREVVIIYSPGLGETQLPVFMREHYPNLKVHYVLQPEMKGQSDALWLARQHLDGPVIVCFSDTLIDADFSFLADEDPAGIAWVKPVPDPRRFGVAELDETGRVKRLVEKPTSLENNRVVVGCYYLRSGPDLLAAVEEQVRTNRSLKGEFFLTEAINVMLEHGLEMVTREVKTWLDTGTIAATLETNRYLLAHLPPEPASPWNPETCQRLNLEIVPPVFIHPSAVISDSVIGPYASIGADCHINSARVSDSILEAGVTLENAALQGSFIGRLAVIHGRTANDPPMTLNVGDNSTVMLK
jgi:glucose-1-phosphate thymidylyltransferase